MPVGDANGKPSASNLPAHQTVSATIPVASVSPRRTPNRCQASRGVSGVGVGVGMSHLSESTRERLAAASQHHPHAQQPLCTDPIGAQHLRQRRTSAREPSIYGQSTFSTCSTEYTSTAGHSDVRTSMSGYGNVHGLQNSHIGSSSSSASSTTSMRYANSLDSLDAVSNSIQQARANSFNNAVGSQYPATAGGGGGVQQIYQHAMMSPRRDKGDDTHDFGYTDTSASRTFQRTFPFRKTTSSSSSKTSPKPSSAQSNSAKSEEDDSGFDNAKRETTRNWRQSADELTESSNGMIPASFWLSPCRIPPRGSVASFGHSAYGSNCPDNGGHKKMMSSDVIATVSPFRTSRGPRSLQNVVNDPETQRLRRELQLEQERVQRLSAQLSTNSHVVSAFEHSLANMTDRLTKLTNSSDKKDKELAELKRMIQHLQDSSDLKGYSTPVRWRSDENVLSGSSCMSVSRNSNNGSESDNEGNKRDSRMWRPKKQTWLRSSLSKAFSRNKSHANGSVGSRTKENLKKETESRQESDFSTAISKQRSVSVSALDDPFVADLQRQLASKDDILTETRLEALSSASQLQGLRETVAKLKSELKLVQRENDDLRQRLRLSNGNLTGSEPIAIDDDKVSSSLFANMSVDRDARDSLRMDVPVIVRVQTRETDFQMKIGYIRMCRRQDWSDPKKWRELDMNVQCVFGLYMARLDPFDRLGMSAEGSIERYQFLGRYRKPVNIENTEIVNEFQETPETPNLKSRVIHISLRSSKKSDGQYQFPVLDEVVFTTLRPRPLLQGFCESWLQIRIGLLIGPKGSGKRFTCQRLAELMVKDNIPVSDSDIFRIPFNKIENDDQRLHLLDEFENNFANTRGRVKIFVAVFEDIDSGDMDSFQRLFLPRVCKYVDSGLSDSKVLVLMTATNPVAALRDIHMATISLTQTDLRIEKSFLGYYLRRKVIGIETETQEANDAMIVAVNWVNRLAIHFEEFCQRIDPISHFSPAPFTNPDLENTHKFRTWFLDLWNSTIVLKLRETINFAQSRGVTIGDVEDPVRFVFRTWPWRDDVAGLPQALRPVQSNSTQMRNRTRVEDQNSKNDDPLLDMLLCLQQATKDSPTENK